MARRGPERDARRWGAAWWRRRAIARAGKWGRRGKEAGKVHHPKVELRWRLIAKEEWQGGDDDGDRGAAAKVATR
jgi:hypothetical protein